ncbi:MAG: hypothetical protein WA782_15520 [Sulfitobacter sp.]
MTDTADKTAHYRTADLPGLGQVQVPKGMSDQEVLAQVLGGQAALSGDGGATQVKKTKKKP